MQGRVFLVLGAAFGALGVITGAFGAHWLRARVGAEALEIHRTAVLYHLLHAPVLVLVGLALCTGVAGPGARAAGWSFCLGMVLFSGSLYALVLSGQPVWGAVTPFGGLALITGWILLALACRRPVRA